MLTVPQDGHAWGPWQFVACNCTLQFSRDSVRYEIDLGTIRDSPTMLDWIFHIRNKAWSTDADIGTLITALNDIFKPQEHLCSFGHGVRFSLPVEWP